MSCTCERWIRLEEEKQEALSDKRNSQNFAGDKGSAALDLSSNGHHCAVRSRVAAG